MKLRFWRRREKDLDEELQSHLQMAAQERVERGESPAHAEQAARREFGNIDLIKEITRDMWGWRWLVDLREDARFGLRMLRKSPGFTIVAVLTLALGIGANTAIFSLMDTVMFRLLPVQRPDELVQVGIMTHGFGQSPRTVYTNPLWESLRARQDIFADVFAWGNTQFNLAPSGVAEDVRGIYVSGSYFPTLGVRPSEGRLIAPDDDKRGCPGVAVLGYGFWQEHFRGAPVAGKTSTAIRSKSSAFRRRHSSGPKLGVLLMSLHRSVRKPSSKGRTRRSTSARPGGST